MEFIGEFIIELVMEGASEAIRCKRIPKHIRYLLTAFVILFVALVIAAVIIAGILNLQTAPVCGGLLIAFGTFMAFLAAKHFIAELRSVSGSEDK